MPQLPSANAGHAVSAIQGVVESLLSILGRYDETPIKFEAVLDKSQLPAPITKMLRRISRDVANLNLEKDQLGQKIQEINEAHAAAEALPTDLEALGQARLSYENALKELQTTTAAVELSKTNIEAVETRLGGIEIEAGAVLKRANEAYSAATTVGLGASFAIRAKALRGSIWVLGGVLVVTLGIGACITYSRVEFVHTLMLKDTVKYGVLWLNLTFTAISVSAPVWLAWLLTRQIGQRFRLAEDYGYKESVARAYEGYRAEAARIFPTVPGRVAG